MLDRVFTYSVAIAFIFMLAIGFASYIPKPIDYDGMMNSTVKVQIMRTVDGKPTPTHGSGVIVDGGILTAAHVVRYIKQTKGTVWAQIEFYGGEKIRAKVKDFEFIESERGPVKDLALLSVDLPDKYTHFITKPRCDGLDVGDKVYVVGNPLTFTWVVTEGRVSSVRPRPGREKGAWLQTDVTIAPGNSGGPVFDSYGNLVGIVSHGAIISGFGASGHFFSVSGREICEFLTY